MNEEILKGNEQAENYTEKHIMSILSTAFHGAKSLSEILKENDITEETFYSWKLRYVNNSHEK
jgi:hypothetical protein